MFKYIYVILSVIFLISNIANSSKLFLSGKNEYGQLGDTSNTETAVLKQIGKHPNWVKFSCSEYSAYAIKYDGSLWVWGLNDKGQLGDSTSLSKNKPVKISQDTNWYLIKGQEESAVAMKNDGTLWAWGSNDKGQLGIGSAENKNFPVKIGTDTNWIEIACGYKHTVAIKKDGTLWAWGLNDFGQLGDGTKVNKSSPVKIGTDNSWVYVNCGQNHTFGIKKDGTLWAWGSNTSMQLGDTIKKNNTIPKKIGNDTNWAIVGRSYIHTTALKKDGSLWAWGLNWYNNFGDGINSDAATPRRIGTDSNWRKLGWGSAFFTYAIKKDSSLWTWGMKISGSSENESTLPVQKGFGIKWSEVNCGESFVMLTDNSKLKVFSVTTRPVNEITANSVECGGEVIEGADEIEAVKTRGLCLSTSPVPTLADDASVEGSGYGIFNMSVTNLLPATKYYIRAYATSYNKTVYGEIRSFVTLNNLPVLNTTGITGITSKSAVSGGEIIDDGGSEITGKGLCWSTSAMPFITNSKTSEGKGKGAFTSNITQLKNNTVYYIRAYAINANGVGYGNELSFTTKALLPNVSTIPVTGIALNSAECGGIVTDDGGDTVTSRGVCWAAELLPTVNDFKTSDGEGLGKFTSKITGLKRNIIYYVRAYAENSTGIAYGSTDSIFIPVELPQVETLEISEISFSSAKISGNIKSDGNAPVTERGFCWFIAEFPTLEDNKINAGTTDIGSYSCTIIGLNYNEFYYVRAFAVNLSGVAYGLQLSFKTHILKPSLISPVNKDTTVNALYTMKWQNLSGIKNYRLQVSTDVGFNHFEFNDIVNSSSIKPNFLNEKSEYYWKVRAITDNDSSDWSDVWYFKTKAAYTDVNETEIKKNIITGIFSGSNSNDIVIKYKIENSGSVSLSLYNSLGMLVSEIIKENSHSEGEYSYNLNISNLPSGVYFISARVNGITEIRKILIY